MMLLFKPKIKQLFPEQATDFPAFVADAPATTVTLIMSEEKLKVHWRPADWAPPDDVRVIGRATVPPAIPGPDPRESVTLCPRTMASKPTKAIRVKRLRAICPTIRKSAKDRQLYSGTFT